jgi:hypothetical protein
MSVDDELRAVVTHPEMQKRLAKYLVLRCFRNSVLEHLPAGACPGSESGDFSDVQVSSLDGDIAWPELARFNEEEMKLLMIDVVNRTYRFIHMLFDDEGGKLILRLAERDPLPRWSEPTLSDDASSKLSASS